MKNTRHTIDPVCGKRLDPEKTPRMLLHYGKKVHFCSPGCMDAFRRSPGSYSRAKGMVGRFLDRLSRSNQREFGSKGPCCH